jgi:hypothetical protein
MGSLSPQSLCNKIQFYASSMEGRRTQVSVHSSNACFAWPFNQKNQGDSLSARNLYSRQVDRCNTQAPYDCLPLSAFHLQVRKGAAQAVFVKEQILESCIH